LLYFQGFCLRGYANSLKLQKADIFNKLILSHRLKSSVKDSTNPIFLDTLEKPVFGEHNTPQSQCTSSSLAFLNDEFHIILFRIPRA